MMLDALLDAKHSKERYQMPTLDKKRTGVPSERATLTPLESTKVTGFGVQATYKMLRAGRIPHIKVGMRFYIPRASLLRWMEASAEQVSGL